MSFRAASERHYAHVAVLDGNFPKWRVVLLLQNEPEYSIFIFTRQKKAIEIVNNENSLTVKRA